MVSGFEVAVGVRADRVMTIVVLVINISPRAIMPLQKQNENNNSYLRSLIVHNN